MTVWQATQIGRQVGPSTRSCGAAITRKEAAQRSWWLSQLFPSIARLASQTGRKDGQKARRHGAAHTVREAAQKSMSPKLFLSTVTQAFQIGKSDGHMPRSCGAAPNTTRAASIPRLTTAPQDSAIGKLDGRGARRPGAANMSKRAVKCPAPRCRPWAAMPSASTTAKPTLALTVSSLRPNTPLRTSRTLAARLTAWFRLSVTSAKVAQLKPLAALSKWL
mmetsp:Transcript_22607/g.40811  ORF Transcript_22607/g.40811 Transcript_22607/m.40811 type:complete len:220 (+) Transcript_22607:1220-1879(+)